MPGRRPSRCRAVLPVAAMGLALLLPGCAGPTVDPVAPTAPSATAAPADLVASIDQSRIHRVGRTVDVHLEAAATEGVRVTRVEIVSSRVEGAVWTGEEDLDPVAQLTLELPPGGCGGDPGFELALTYTVAGGPAWVSTVPATDLYGAVGRLLDRDCAASVLAEAATLVTGELRVVGGEGPDSVLELPVTLTPTGRRDDVVVRGFEDTVLLAQADGSASAADGRTRVRLGRGRGPVTLVLRVVPARCDPHVLAEDKVGTLFPIVVEAPGIAADVRPYLPLSDADRAALRRFVPRYCEW
ncbi:hypothetical protein NOMA109596_15530 [Nocardioides marinus]|uniref:Lipoprotein n=1 Tax=Nocardioides marinus TaxID=374514 RepID=A0A7Z0C1J4_9ACTN|nr:hypothetical protein [Nocardioides marinus]NYI09068.1 hypothetical protein [Nocardioides marinus]